MVIHTTSTQDRAFLVNVIGNQTLEEAIAWIVNSFSPEEIFDEKELGDWAENNGYVQED